MEPSRKLSVLLADDDADDLELIQSALQDLEPGLQLHTVDRGKKVLAFLRQQQDITLPALLVLDYNMPDLNATQILLAMKDEPRYCMIAKVILSTSNAPSFIEECKKAGAIEYFVKPSTTAGLQKIARQLLEFAQTNTN